MQTKNNRLGKGLDALIPSIIPKTSESIQHIDVNKIKPNPFQPRKHFDQEAIDELAHSINENGLAQPIVVRQIDSNQFEIVVGERRLRACKQLDIPTVPCIVRQLTDKESCKIALIENLDRQDLSAIEIAASYQQLITDFNFTQQELSEQIGRSRSSIANILRLLQLPAPIHTMIMNGQLTEGHARSLVEFANNPRKCIELATTIIEKNLTVRQAEKLSTPSIKKPPKAPIHLFDNYTEQLSKKFNTNVKITHSKQQLTMTLSYQTFKEYIAFLDQLCNVEDPSLES